MVLIAITAFLTVTTYASVGNVDNGIVRDLHADTKYSFRVAAYNKAGNGPFSEPMNKNTPHGGL